MYPPHSTGFTDSSRKVLSGRNRIEKEVNYFHPNLKCLCLSLQRLACDLHEDFEELFSMFAMSVLAVCLNRPRVMKKRRWKEGRREGGRERGGVLNPGFPPQPFWDVKAPDGVGCESSIVYMCVCVYV